MPFDVSGSGSAEQEEEDEDSDSFNSVKLPSHSQFLPTKDVLDAFYREWKIEVSAKRTGAFKHHATMGDLEPSKYHHPINVLAYSDYLRKIDLIERGFSTHAKYTKLYRKFTHALFHGSSSCGLYVLPNNDYDDNSQLERPLTTHISKLPYELLLKIFKYSLGDNLNIRILATLSLTCRGFYLVAHDVSLWRSICLRRWPLTDCYSFYPSSSDNFVYSSWREMAIFRPQVLYHGCYFCRISYVRSGEPDIGTYYKPFFRVVYYRGIRFYPDYRVSMFTAPATPAFIVSVLGKPLNSKLNSMFTQDENDPTYQALTRVSTGTLLQGTYRWSGHNSIICTLYGFNSKKEQLSVQRRRQIPNITPKFKHTFIIEFAICNHKSRRHQVLRWESYIIRTLDESSGNETVTTLEMSKEHFPPCHFSRVPCFTQTFTDESG